MNRKKTKPFDVIRHILLSLVALALMSPALLALAYSLKPGNMRFVEFNWLNHLTLKSYVDVLFTDKPYLHYISNSVIICLSSVILATLIGCPAAFIISRVIQKKKRDNVLFFFLSLRILPPAAVIVPYFLMMITFKLIDNKLALIIPYTLFNLGVVIYILGRFFEELPQDAEEAAMLDGCTLMGVFRHIGLPLVVPALIAVFIICILFSWNEFLFAMVLTGPLARTLPVGITEFLTPFRIQWEWMFATSIIIITVPILMVVFLQRFLVKGLVILTGIRD